MAITGFSTGLRSSARNGERTQQLGLWATFLSPYGLELAAGSGPAWLGLDLQHGDLEPADVTPLVRVASLAGLPTLARLASHDAVQLARALDTGVDGVIVPSVSSAAEAEALVAAARVPPVGRRSTGASRAALEPIGRPSETGASREEPLLLVMVETADGVAVREEIAATPGVDGIMVGPYDLALSMGRTAPTEAPVVTAIRSVLEAAAGQGLVTAAYAGNPALRAVLPPVDLLAVDTDATALRAGLRGLFSG